MCIVDARMPLAGMHLDHWLRQVALTRTQNALVVALDDTAAALAQAHGVQSVVLKTPLVRCSTCSIYAAGVWSLIHTRMQGSAALVSSADERQHAALQKWQAIALVLRLGCSLFYIDTNVGFDQNPFDALRRDSDIEVRSSGQVIKSVNALTGSQSVQCRRSHATPAASMVWLSSCTHRLPRCCL